MGNCEKKEWVDCEKNKLINSHSETIILIKKGEGDMKDSFDNQFEGQITIEEVLKPPDRLFAVSNIFARARKHMTLNEQKTFVYDLTEIKFTEDPKSEYVRINTKVLAAILKNNNDIDHLSQNLYDEIKDLPKHSYIEIANRDLELFSNGFIVTSVTRFKNIIRIRFNYF